MTVKNVPDEWWQQAVKVLPHAVACVDKTGKIVWANAAWCELYQYPLSELVTKRWQDITELSDVGADDASVMQVIQGILSEYTMQKTYIKRSGERFPAVLYVHRFPEVGDVTLFVSCVDPITQQKIEIAEIRQEVEELRRVTRQHQAEITRSHQDDERAEVVGEWIEKWWLKITAATGLAWVVGRELYDALAGGK
jgi:PAS domain S-box-containing protein